MYFRRLRKVALHAAFLCSAVLAPSVALALPISNQLELSSDDGQIIITLVDDQRGVVYLGLTDDDGLSKLVLVEKDGLGLGGMIELGAVELLAGVISTGAGSAYIGLGGDPGKILQVDLEGFVKVGELTLPHGQTLLPVALGGSSEDAVYFALTGDPGRILQIDTATLEVNGTLELEERESGFTDAVPAPDGHYAYWAANHVAGTFPALVYTKTIVKIDLENFERADSLQLSSSQMLTRLFMDPEGESLWAWGRWSPNYLTRIDLEQFEVVDALELPQGVPWVNAAVMEASGRTAIFAGGAEPPTLLRVDLQNMQLMDSVLLSDESLAALFGGVASANQPSVYFPSANEPARLVELDIRKPYLRFTPTALDFGQSLVGFPALPRTVSLANIGGGTADFLEFQDMPPTVTLAEHNCPSQLEPGSGCNLTILFEATSPGPNGGVFWALSSNAVDSELELHAFGQESLEMAVTDFGLGPDWFYDDFLDLSKPVVHPDGSTLHFWASDGVGTGAPALDTVSLGWLLGYASYSGLWDTRAVNSAVAHDGSAVYAALEEHGSGEGILIRSTGIGHPSVLYPSGNPDPISVVKASAIEDRVWFATGSDLARLFEVDGDDFTIVDELQASNDGGVDSLVLNEPDSRILLALNTNPLRIVEVNLNDFEIGRELELPLVEGRLRTGLIDPDAGYAYFASTAIPAEIVKVALDGLSLAGSLQLEAVVGQVLDGALDPARGRAYLLGDGPDGATLNRLDLEGLVADAPVRLGPDFHSTSGLAMTIDRDYALIPAQLEADDRGVVIRMRLNAAQLRLEPAIIDFGKVPQFGSPISTEVWLHNDGSRVANLLHFYLSAADFVLSSSECLAGLQPGESCRLEISIDPLHAGARSGVLHVHNDNGGPALLAIHAAVEMPVFRDRFELHDGQE